MTPTPTASRILLLIDVDNFFKPEFLDDGLDRLSSDIHRFVDFALNLVPSPERIDLRLYGGWLENSVLTPRASLIEQIISASPLFPFRNPASGEIVRGEILLVKSLLVFPDIQWGSTFRLRGGLPRLRIDAPLLQDGCVVASDLCPIRTLARFTKSRDKRCPVSGCAVTNNKAFKCAEQKMVDTLIICDLLETAYNDDTAAVALFTEDSDLLPSLVHARHVAVDRQTAQRHILVFPRPQLNTANHSDLQSLGAEVRYWS
jgi:hypothetical protein